MRHLYRKEKDAEMGMEIDVQRDVIDVKREIDMKKGYNTYDFGKRKTMCLPKEPWYLGCDNCVMVLNFFF